MKRFIDDVFVLFLWLFVAGCSRLAAQQSLELIQPDSGGGYTDGRIDLISFDNVNNVWTVQITCSSVGALELFTYPVVYTLPDPGQGAMWGQQGANPDNSPHVFTGQPRTKAAFAVENDGGVNWAYYTTPPAPGSYRAEAREFRCCL